MTTDTLLKVEDYKRVYELILTMSYDVEEFNTFNNITEEEIEKCKWIKCIVDTLTDVPERKMSYVFKRKKIKFDRDTFLEENEQQQN